MAQPSILISGGSLAGMATAIRLKQLGYDVQVLEGKTFPRQKFCGGFLGPDSFQSLQTLGLWDAVRQLGYGPIENAVFYTAEGKPLSIRLAWLNQKMPYGLGIMRNQLDTVIMDYAKAIGVDILEDHHVLPQIRRHNNQFGVDVTHQQVQMEKIVDILIDASGRQSRLSINPHKASQRNQSHQSPYLGIRQWVRLNSPETDDKLLRMFFFPHGYGGLQPVTKDIYNLCLMTSQSVGSTLNQGFETWIAETVAQNPIAAKLLAQATPVESCQTTSVETLDWTMPPEQGLIRVGDAMVTVDPFTGSGMALALQTGLMAAEAIAVGLRAGQSYAEMNHIYLRHYHQRYARRFWLLKHFRPALYSAHAHRVMLPWISPFLPALTRIFR